MISKFIFIFLFVAVVLFQSYTQDDPANTMLDELNEKAQKFFETQDGESADPSLEDTLLDDDFNEDEFVEDYDGPIVDVIHDNRSGAQYMRVYTRNEETEYHYLKYIRYSELVLVLTDLLKRITDSGFIWASDLITEYEPYSDEPAIIYKVDKVNDRAFGIVQFPDFKIWISGTKVRTEENKLESTKANVLAGLIMQFIFSLAQVEETLGINQSVYGKNFFKQE